MKLIILYIAAAWLATTSQIYVACAANPLQQAGGVTVRRRLDRKKSPQERECELCK